MDFGQNQLKDTLRSILSSIHPIAPNMPLIGQINDLLAAETIEPVPYSYTCPFYTAGGNNNIAAGAQGIGQINIQNDAPFMVITQQRYVNAANAAQTPTTQVIPNLLVLINDSGSGANLMDQLTPVDNLFGTAQLPFVLPEPRVFASNATLNITVQNIDAAAGCNLWLTFNGVKLFRK